MIGDIGSIWRRWDFHVHTPYSFLNNGFGDYTKAEVWDEYVKILFNKAIQYEIGAIFLTDYFIIEGYKAVLSILKDKKRLSQIFADEISKDKDYLEKIYKIPLFPNIEFRMGKTVEKNKLQYHILFSNKINPEIIENNFLRHLSCKISDKNYYLTLSDIEKIGNECIEKHIGESMGNNPFKRGLNLFYVELEDAIDLLESDEIFKNNYIVVCAEEDMSHMPFTSQSGLLRQGIYQSSNARFSASPKDIEWGDSEDCLKMLGHKLPCIFGSDSHKNSEIFESAAKHYCWIKSDTTFKGLLDALNSSKERIFIGEKPDQLIKQNSRSAYSIKKIVVTSKTDEGKNHWVNDTIELNQAMVSIIGNKGSGKSALSDIIGMLGNSSKSNYYSFLTQKRFFYKNNAFANDYVGYLEYYDGSKSDEIALMPNQYDDSNPENVSYLPQRYIEITCNETTEKDYFTKEINNIIFSYLDDIEKEGFSDLDSLVNSKCKEIDLKIATKKQEIQAVNLLIVEKERMGTSANLKSLQVKQKNIEREIINHKLNKPTAVNKPIEEGDNEKIVLLNQCSELYRNLDSKHIDDYKRYKEIEEDFKVLESIDFSVRNICSDALTVSGEIGAFFRKKDVKIDYDIEINEKNKDAYLEYKCVLKTEQETLRKKLIKVDIEQKDYDIDNMSFETISLLIDSLDNHIAKKGTLKTIMNQLAQFVSNEQAEYQKYISDLDEWATKLSILEKGDPNNSTIDSLKSIKEKIQYVIDSLPLEISALKQQRLEKIKELYDLFVVKNEKLKMFYASVQKQLDAILIDNPDKIAFESKIVPDNNIAKIIDDMINHRVASEFKDTAEIVNLVAGTDFGQKDCVVDFINSLLEKANTSIDSFYSNALKNNGGQKDFYNYLTCLNYLSIQYSLKMNNKSLEQLSPGEKGVLLLVFYLALDKDSKPLIIDQPEDNLDNQSIYLRLTNLIKVAKNNRQIIVVTHNPNIAVACDSEQIIFAQIEQETNRIVYESGSIENPKMGEHILNVLEGTKPAFDFRSEKYN